MPAQTTAASVALPSDTLPPGLTRRRVWAAPQVRSHSLLVLTLPRLYLAPPAADPKPETIAAVEAALDVGAALGPLATVIETAAVRRVKLDLSANAVVIDYVVSTRPTRTTVTFADPATADAVFGKLWRRLGTGFALRPTDDPWAIARAPVAFMAALLAGVGVLSIALNALDDLALKDEWLVPRFLPNWRVLCGLGGAAVAGMQVWLYRRLARPPERLVIQRTSAEC